MIVLTADRDFNGGLSIAAIRAIAEQFPGTHALRIDVGATRMKLGPAWRVDPCRDLMAALSEWGDARTVPDPSTHAGRSHPATGGDNEERTA